MHAADSKLVQTGVDEVGNPRALVESRTDTRGAWTGDTGGAWTERTGTAVREAALAVEEW